MNDEVNEILELPSLPNNTEIPIAPVRKRKLIEIIFYFSMIFS
jgi:hypothetical protein